MIAAIAITLPPALFTSPHHSSRTASQLSSPSFTPRAICHTKKPQPTYFVPTEKLRFTLQSVQTKVRKRRIGGKSSLLIYEKIGVTGQRFYFGIKTTDRGIASIPKGADSYAYTNPTFGGSSIEFGLYGQATQNNHLGNWVGPTQSIFVRFVGTNILPETQQCQNIQGVDAVRISSSIAEYELEKNSLSSQVQNLDRSVTQ